MRIITLSVDGIFQAADRGLYDWLSRQDADIICLQDIRALEPELDNEIFHPKGYFSYFFDSGTPDYSGVAIYTRFQPKALIYGLGLPCGLDMAGRYLQIDYESFSIGSLLAPTGYGDESAREQKDIFFSELQALMHKVTRKRRHFIYCGNWSIAHTRQDVQFWQEHEQHIGFLASERQWLDQVFKQLGYLDAFRKVNRDSDEFSWLPNEANGLKGGWRTDMQIVSEALKKQIEYGMIYKKQHFSSHLPVIIDYDIEQL